jgi:hypothetical protein
MNDSFLALAINFGLVILIWMIQILIYPSFLYYSDDVFIKAMRAHQRKMTLIVFPLMMSELILSIYHVFNYRSLYAMVSLFLVILIWLSTIFIQMPIHERLLINKNQSEIYALIKTNWIRTVLWSIKLLILISQIYL